MTERSEKLAHGVDYLNIGYLEMCESIQVYPIETELSTAYLIEADGGMFLVDGGSPGNERKNLDKMQSLGREDLNMENWSDLNKDGIKISVTQGTTMERYLTKYLPKAKILRFPSNGESVAAFQSISPGQWEAGKAIGMTYVQQMRRVILPQAIKRMIPAFTNRGVELTKMTSLASVIAYAELIHQAKTISTMNFNPIETSTIVAIIYFTVVQKAESNAPIPIAVVDFVNETGEDELNSLSGMLTTALEQTRRLSVITRSRMFDILKQLNKQNIPQETTRAVSSKKYLFITGA